MTHTQSVFLAHSFSLTALFYIWGTYQANKRKVGSI